MSLISVCLLQFCLCALLFHCQAAEMALRLASVNRWCVSGTPVQRGLEGKQKILKLSEWALNERLRETGLLRPSTMFKKIIKTCIRQQNEPLN